MISFGCSSSDNLLLESMPYCLLEFEYILLTFLCVWDDLIESEGIDGNLWALHTEVLPLENLTLRSRKLILASLN